MAKTIGIDLGTTNSVMAVMEGGKPTVITNNEGSRTTPSIVAFSKTGERLVGQLAKRQAILNPDKTIISIKRKMGSDKKTNVDGKDYTPQEISAMILRKLADDASKYLGEKVIVTIKNNLKLKGTLFYDETYDNYHLTKINEPIILLKSYHILKIEKS